MMIKIDIAIPTNCFDCPCCDGENGRCNITHDFVYDKRPFDCPMQEVKQDEWEEVNGVFFCSRCGGASTSMRAYCSNCGAEMLLKRKENEDG